MMFNLQSRRVRGTITNAVRYLILLPLVVIFIFPFIWMVLTSLKTPAQINSVSPVWIPLPPQWNNYAAALREYLPFGRPVLNTLAVASLTIVGTLVFSSLVAYGFAKMEFPGRNLLFGILLSTMMIPFMVRLIPLFIIYRQLGWLDTLYPLWVPAFFGTPFYIFFMRQFFRTIPDDLIDSARIDGCSEFGIWWRIMLPLSTPMLIVVAIFAFQGSWNEFLAPLLFISDQAQYTLMMAVWFIVSSENTKPWHHLMAVSTLMVMPMIIVFFFSQQRIVQGITITGIKG
jgi:multiple sugar transport system permease protein